MGRVPLVDKKTGLATGQVWSREHAEKRDFKMADSGVVIDQYKPVSIVLVRNNAGNILRTVRGKGKSLSGKAFFGIGEHATATERLDYKIDKKRILDRNLGPDVKCESPQAAAARAFVHELGPDGEEADLGSVYFHDVKNLGVHTAIDLSDISSKQVDQQYHHFYGLVYQPKLHGKLHPRESEIFQTSFVQPNYERIAREMSYIDNEEYIEEFIKAVRKLEELAPLSPKNKSVSDSTFETYRKFNWGRSKKPSA